MSNRDLEMSVVLPVAQTLVISKMDHTLNSPYRNLTVEFCYQYFKDISEKQSNIFIIILVFCLACVSLLLACIANVQRHEQRERHRERSNRRQNSQLELSQQQQQQHQPMQQCPNCPGPPPPYEPPQQQQQQPPCQRPTHVSVRLDALAPYISRACPVENIPRSRQQQ